jgi:Photosynthesis system II assembly factor YCF48
MPSEDRDQQLDRALARHLRSASPDAACPDAEILAAYHERSLSLEEMAHWKAHIATCSRCQETLALLEQTDSVAANDWEKQQSAAGLPGVKGIAQADSVPARFAATTAPVPVAMPGAAKVVAKTRRRVRWSIVVPAGTLAAGLLVWVAVHESSHLAKHEQDSVQVAENREASPPAPRAIPESGKAEARDEGSAALQSRNLPERMSATPSTTSALPVKPMPSTRLVAPPSAPQDLAKSKQDNLAHLDSSTSAYAHRAKDAEGLVGGTRTAGAAPAAPKVAAGRAGGPLISNQAQNQMQNQTANQYSNQAVAPPANQPVGGVSEQVTVEAGKQPVTEDKKGARKALKEKNEEVAVGAVTETVEVTSTPPAPAADTFAQTSVNGKAVFLSSLQNSNIVVSQDQKHIWRIGPAGKIESSTDMGKTWRTQMSGVTADLVSGSAPSGKICWIAGKEAALLLTTDGGKHWKQLASPISGDIGGVSAVDAQNAAIWDISNHNRFETSDGGLTWKQVANQ